MLDYVVFLGLIAAMIITYVLHERKMKGVLVELTPFEKELNKTESPIERKVFKSLWFRNHPVVTQYPIKKYRLDIAFPALKICVEFDGREWHSSPSQKARDRRRDKHLESLGWVTLRFSGSQINRDLNSVISKIESEIQKKHSIY